MKNLDIGTKEFRNKNKWRYNGEAQPRESECHVRKIQSPATTRVGCGVLLCLRTR